LFTYIISQGISEENLNRLNAIGDRYHKKIEVIEQPDLESIVDKKIDIQRYSLSMFSRLIADTLLPEQIEKLIYLDCDVIVNGDIRALWDINISEYTLGAVDDMRSHRYCRNLGMKQSSHYVNSGVLLINLKRYRELKWQKKMLNGIVSFNSMLEFPDNDLICKLMEDEIKLIHPKFNVFSSMYMGNYEKCMRMRRPKDYYSSDEFYEAKANPVVIHYTTCFAFAGRPWQEGCTHPEKSAFDKYYRLSPWKDIPYQFILTGANDRIRKIYTRLPDRAGAFFIWFLHSWLKPNLQYFTKKRYLKIFCSDRS